MRSRARGLTHNNSVDVQINEDIIPKRASLRLSKKDSVASLASFNQIDVTKMSNYKPGSDDEWESSSEDSDMPACYKKSSEDLENYLTKKEKEIFGDRCPEGFKKLGVLGKGQETIVWLAEYEGQEYALKQIPRISETNK